MIREEDYHRIAEEFQVNVGIAEWTEPFYPQYERVSDVPDSVRAVILTKWIIKEGIYQPVIREVIRLEKKYGNRRIKKSTIYEKAIDIVVERNRKG